MIRASSLPCGAWRKSTYSAGNGGNCLEIADDFAGAAVPVRDSKNAHGPALLIGAGAWRAFVTQVRKGGFDNR